MASRFGQAGGDDRTTDSRRFERMREGPVRTGSFFLDENTGEFFRSK